ncbi:hypothetical protein LIER_26585 [Lithospermum erythrorhizon]|uniref:Uncharacterized protein n=1 Tax=Lithospermum erythrorhizon TaxID=34254 RepID=A0AAV3RAF2_LITER
MIKTRREVNKSEKETKGKKKGVGPSDDSCMVVEPLMVSKGAQKVKGRKLKASVSTKPVTAKDADEAVLPSVTETDAEITSNMEGPTVGQSVDETLDVQIQEVIPEDARQKKKFKKRKHKKSVDVGESFEPKRKFSKEERKA